MSRGGRCGKHADLLLRNNKRSNPQPDKVVFKELMPLALRNHVKSTSSKNKEKACMEEMMNLMDCMNKFQQDKTMCSKEAVA